MHIKHMHEMIEKLTDCTKEAIESNETCVGKYPISDVVDMIKDLNEAEYYAYIVKAMKEAEEEEKEDEKAELRELRQMADGDHMGRMGYDRYRYKNGRFAPKGRGRRMGYRPPMMDHPYDEEDFMGEYWMDPSMRNVHMMGYTEERNGRSERGERPGESARGRNGRYGYETDGRGGEGESSRYGRSYDNYRSAKRNYTESKDPEAQRRMRESIAEVFDDMEDITVDMVKEMTPEEKQKYKQKLQQMMQKIQ